MLKDEFVMLIIIVNVLYTLSSGSIRKSNRFQRDTLEKRCTPPIEGLGFSDVSLKCLSEI